MSVRIICDSASDITREMAQKLKVTVLPIKVLFGEEEYLDGVNLSHKEFYEKLIETDKIPTTSQISPYDFEEAFNSVVQSGDKAVCITISSKLSGCFQSASIASEVHEKSIYVVDSENVSIGEKVLVELAVRLRDEGKSAEEIVETLKEERKKIRIIALLDTLEYLKKGGRISGATAFAGTILAIKPVVTISDGKVSVIGKARGSKNANNILNRLIEKEGSINFNKPYSLAYSGLSDNLLQKYIKDSSHIYKGKTEKLPICTIGCSIGTHAGPGAIAAAFYINE